MTETLAWDILARDHMSDVMDKLARTAELLSRVLDKVGDEGQTMGRKMEEAQHPAKELGDEIDRVGRESVKSAVEMKVLSHEIEATEGKLKSLAAAFQAGGDKSSLIGEFRKARSELSTLKKMAEEIEPDSGGLFSRIRQSVTNGIGSGIDGAVSFIQQHPLIAGAIAVSIAGAGPLIAGALGGVIGLALGGGALAGGIALAASDPKVSGAFHQLFDNILGPLRDAAKVLIEPLQYAAGTLDAAFRHIEPTIRRIFEILGPVTSRLAGAFGLLLERMMPGLEKAVQNSVAFFNVLANELPKIGSELGDFFERVTRSKGAVEAFTAALDLIRVTLRGAGMLIEYLSDRFSTFMHGIDVALQALSSLPAPLKAILGISTWIDGAAKSWHGYADSLAPAATGTSDLDRETSKLVGTTQELDKNLNAVQSDWDELFNTETTAAHATDAANKALLDLWDTFKQNGKAVDEYHEKGIANREAILGTVEALQQEREALINKLAPTLGVQRATEEANTRYERNIDLLLEAAEASGLDRDKVLELIGAMKDVPGIIPTDFQLKNLGLAEDDIREYKRLLLSVPQSVPVGAAPAYHASGQQFRASGGSAGGWTRIGENGPEDLYLPPGSFVKPNNQLSGGVGTTTDVIDVPLRMRDAVTGEVVQQALLRLVTRRGYRTVAQLLPGLT